MKIIAISGWKKSGKDTAANYIIKKHFANKVSLADPLKELTAKQYNLPILYMYSQDLKEKPLLNMPVITTDKFTEAIHSLLKSELGSGYWTPRALLILEGSIKRSVNSSYWLEQIVNKIKSNEVYMAAADDIYGTKTKELVYVVPDLRYVNEAEELRKAFGKDLITIRINRFDSIDTEDPSERDLDNYKFDYVIENKDSEEEFITKIEILLKEIL
jgi:hypothetical protein